MIFLKTSPPCQWKKEIRDSPDIPVLLQRSKCCTQRKKRTNTCACVCHCMWRTFWGEVMPHRGGSHELCTADGGNCAWTDGAREENRHIWFTCAVQRGTQRELLIQGRETETQNSHHRASVRQGIRFRTKCVTSANFANFFFQTKSFFINFY